ncbi:MAG: class I SAM-dependent methyltransferase [Candidatus Micrarchaeota archaeon]
MVNMALNDEQKAQIERQLARHHHESFRTDLWYGKTHLKGFSIHAKVHRPDIMGGSQVMATFLAEHPEYYKGFHALDMGCGSGILGTVMAKNGAYKVVMADNSRPAVANSQENIENFGLKDRASAIESDLFSKIKGKSHLIVFNHPFFPGDPADYRDSPAAATMLDEGSLLKRFLRDAHKHLLPGGRILMPFFHLAGETSNPEIRAKEHGYDVKKVFGTNSTDSIQKGEISIYELTLKAHSDLAAAREHPIVKLAISPINSRTRLFASVIGNGRKAILKVESPVASDLIKALHRNDIRSSEITSTLKTKYHRIIVHNLDEPSASLINALRVIRDEKNMLRQGKKKEK